MGCGCEPCDTLNFGCAWCGEGDFTCVRWDELGRCIKYDPASPVPDPETCGAGEQAYIEITFTDVAAAEDWIMPPGGVSFWLRVDGMGTPPTPHDDFAVDVGASPTLSEIVHAFALSFDAHGFAVVELDETLYLTRDAAGLVPPADKSGPFTFANEGDGEDASEEDFCLIPRVETLPYDDLDYSGFAGLGDHDACMDTALSDFEDEMEVCAELTFGTEAHCTCVKEASYNRVEAEWNCRIAVVSEYLDGIQTQLNKRAECCGGPYSECAKEAEDDYLEAVTAFEEDHLTALRDGELLYVGPSCIDGDGDSESFMAVRADKVELVRHCHLPTRYADISELIQTREKDISDCKFADMERRDICPAYQHRCELNALADYNYEVRSCEATYWDCVCSEGENCHVAWGECISAAFLPYMEARLNCCKEEHPWAPYDFEMDECEMEASVGTVTVGVPCCNDYVACLNLCTDPYNLDDCNTDCGADRIVCEAELEYPDPEECASKHGDCPDCWDLSVTLEEPTPYTCTVENPDGPPTCIPLDEFGYCPGAEDPGCPDPISPECDATNCCSVPGPPLEVDIITCTWFPACYVGDWTPEAPWEDIEECPSPLPAPPPLPLCSVSIDY